MSVILIVFLSGRGKLFLLFVVRVFIFVFSDIFWYGGIIYFFGIFSFGISFLLEVYFEFFEIQFDDFFFFLFVMYIFCFFFSCFVIRVFLGRGVLRVVYFRTVDFSGLWFILWMVEQIWGLKFIVQVIFFGLDLEYFL